MAAGLFYVYTEPGSVDEAEFHDWYDHEHGPAPWRDRVVASALRRERRVFGLRNVIAS
jgi:hypothetical protein